MVRELLRHGEGDDVPVQLGVPLGECPEERGDGLVQVLHGALGGGRRVAVVPRVAHAHTVTALVPEGPETQHALLAAGAVSLARPALAQLLNEAFAHITSTQCFVAAQ